jgi:catechol 2,3-dioxygenase-like lactoylglutathione lyase family enzyme
VAPVIQHVSLECRPEDAGALLAFWAALGFAEVEPPPALRARSTWVQAPGGFQVHFLWTSEPVAPPGGHTAVVADDYDATIDALRAAGFAPEPREQHWGAPRAFVRGPGGHLVEVMAAPPGAG